MIFWGIGARSSAVSTFFKLFALFSVLLWGAAFAAGLWGPYLGLNSGQHLLLGLAAGITAVSVHCLIFAIFTGAGKDTRLLVEDWGLDPSFVKRAKGFKRTIFPPALYCILFILLTTSFGGLYSARAGSAAYRWLHLLLAAFTFIYHLKVLWKEVVGVEENARLIEEVNRVAAEVTSRRPLANSPDAVIPGAVEEHEWGTHVYAFGKFLTFLGLNAWLVYIYFKYITWTSQTPFWPFLVSSLVLLAGGGYLRLRYRAFRPRRPGQAA